MLAGDGAAAAAAAARPNFQAESPDEEALVLGALDELGYAFTGRSRAECRARVAGAAGGASDEAWEVLATIPFDSARKRMTVVARRAGARGGGARVLCKGADSIVFARVAADGYARAGGRARLDAALGEFARDGLRTLVLAQRELLSLIHI